MMNRACFNNRRWTTAAIAFSMVAVATSSALGQWPQLAADAARSASSPTGPPNLSARLWLASQGTTAESLDFVGPSSPVVFANRIFTNVVEDNGVDDPINKLVAFDRTNGAAIWETPVAPGVNDSWSSPAVDTANGTVLLASGNMLHAVDSTSGALAWITPLDLNVVNATPVVADDLSPGRAFITDSDPYGGGSQLYCINTSLFNAATNPFQPGDVVWQEPIGGASGATPVYHGGVVFVAVAAGPGGFPGVGRVYAFDVNAPPGSRQMWVTAVGPGFFGGVAYANGFIYAAAYAFFGSGDNSLLAKLRASDGVIQWTVPCERTASIPVVSGNRIYLSCGLPGFGSTPKVEAFRDDGASATKIWDTYVDSAGTLNVGGWNHQPARVADRLYVGRMPNAGNLHAANTDLYILDLTRTPADPLFVRDHRTSVGSSPAIVGGRLYSIGPTGLNALAARGDFSDDGRLDGNDIQGFCSALSAPVPSPQQIALSDFDASAVLGPADAAAFRAALLGN